MTYDIAKRIFVLDKLLRTYRSGLSNGSVFRIGGDGFVVLLVGKGYETREESMRDLNRQVEANISTDEVVISIGCSTLEPGDEQLHDAFTRADQLMYDRKKELKSMGAKTRES